MSDWPGVNCGLSVSRKPVSTNDSRLDMLALLPSAGVIVLRRSVLRTISVVLCDSGVVRPLGVSCVRDPARLWRLPTNDKRELKWETLHYTDGLKVWCGTDTYRETPKTKQKNKRIFLRANRGRLNRDYTSV